MILKITSLILIFIVGISDRAFGLNIWGYTVYLGLFLFLILKILNSNKLFITLLGFIYFMGLQSTENFIGPLLIIFLAFDYGYELIDQSILSRNKISVFFLSFIFSDTIYMFTLFVVGGYKLYLSVSLLILLIFIGLIGGLTSFFLNKHER